MIPATSRRASALLVLLLAASFAPAVAQPSAKPPPVGILWRELGWVEVQDVVIEYRPRGRPGTMGDA